MISASDFSIALSTVISLLAAWFVYHSLLKDAEIDRFRDRIFQLRDELFDLVVEGKLRPDDPAYVVLRRRLNGFIRFGHRLSVPTAAGLALSLPRKAVAAFIASDEWSERMQELERADPEVYTRLDRLSDDTGKAVLGHILLMSPVLVAIASPVLVLGLIGWRWVGRTRRFLEDLRQRIRYLAEAGGPGGPAESMAA